MLNWWSESKRHPLLIASFLSIALPLVASTSGVFAEYEDVNIEIGVLPVVKVALPHSVTITPEPGGSMVYAKMPIIFETNSVAGYSALIGIDGTLDGEHDEYIKSLVNTTNSAYYIRPLENPIDYDDRNNFPFDRWGCSTNEDDNFRALSTIDAPNIRYFTRTSTAANTHNLNCGARVSKTLASGVYNTTIVVSVVSNVVPDTILSINYMQEISDTVIATMETGKSYQLVDGRDQKIYWVTKMLDGNVWMTQNLDHDPADDEYVYAYDFGSQYPENEDDSSYSNNDLLYKDGGDYYYDVNTGTYKDANTLAINSEDLHYHVGSFYSPNHSREPASSTMTPNDYDYNKLCPFGWGIPSQDYQYGNFERLSFLYPNNIDEAFYLAPMGYINGNGVLSGVGEVGYYIDRTRLFRGNLIIGGERRTDSMRALSVDNSYNVTDSALSDTSGGFIRCIARPAYQHWLSYYDDLYLTTNSNYVKGSSIFSFSRSVTRDIEDAADIFTGAIPEGYTLLGWTDNPNEMTTPTVTSVTTTINDTTWNKGDENAFVSKSVYAVWEHNYTEEAVPFAGETYSDQRTIDDITYMQDITPEIVSNTQVEATKQLIDSRDGKRYWVRKLNDGNLWMEQNLDLDLTNSITLTPSNSNVLTNRTLRNTAATHVYNNAMEIVQIHKTSTSIDESNLALDSSEWRNAPGSLYNAYTISAGSLTNFSAPQEMTESICPKGWYIPSANNTSNHFYGRVDYSEVANFSASFVFASANINGATSSTYNNYIGKLSFDDYRFTYTPQNTYIYSGSYARCVAPQAEITTKTMENISTMQEMTPNICAATPVGTEVMLADKRDGKKYFVRKMSNGTCWMVQNLDYTFPRGTYIYGDNATWDGYWQGGGYLYDPGTESRCSSATVACHRSTNNRFYIGSYSGKVFASIDNVPENSYFRKYYYGTLYNFTAAVGGGSIDIYSTTPTTYPRSICPAGWRLPLESDEFIPNEGDARKTIGASYSSSSTYMDTYGGYWLNRGYYDYSYITSFYRYYYDGSLNSYSYSNNYLLPVRCIAR